MRQRRESFDSSDCLRQKLGVIVEGRTAAVSISDACAGKALFDGAD
jgi:hypothetical protein